MLFYLILSFGMLKWRLVCPLNDRCLVTVEATGVHHCGEWLLSMSNHSEEWCTPLLSIYRACSGIPAKGNPPSNIIRHLCRSQVSSFGANQALKMAFLFILLYIKRQFVLDLTWKFALDRSRRVEFHQMARYHALEQS